MKRYIFILSGLLFALFAILSCRKVININLNDSAPKIIIEGSIADQPSSCFIRLSKSVNYNTPNTFPPVTGAVVTLTDNLGNTTSLTGSPDGYYYTVSSFRGFPGRTYTISVTSEGKTYTATSVMPAPVTIDTISQSVFFMGSRNGKIITVRIEYNDQAGVNNYYRFIEIKNGKVSDAIRVDDDLLRDGNTITQEIFQRDTEGTSYTAYKPGDTVTILLQTIDKGVYEYLNQLNHITSGYGGQSASPANPTSNFNNGALGYFSAYAVRSKSIVIK